MKQVFFYGYSNNLLWQNARHFTPFVAEIDAFPLTVEGKHSTLEKKQLCLTKI